MNQNNNEIEGEGDWYIPYEYEEPEAKFNFISSVIDSVIEKVIPEKHRTLTLKRAQNCLQVLGKIWNLSEHPPTNYMDLISDECDKKLMDMEGYIDDYQYLHIEAVDLGLTDIKVIPQHFIWLLSADLSGNRLDDAKACPMTKLPNLVALKLNRNRFEDPYLPPVKHLQYLGMDSNKIESLENIYHPNLETLTLNFNLIKKVDAKVCEKHTKLKQLELRGNKLKTTAGIEYVSLVNLYLAQNQITELKGLEILVNLKRLHLRQNPLGELKGFSSANKNLKYLNLRKCQIPNVEEIKNLSVLEGLQELIIKSNLFNPEKVRRAKARDGYMGELEGEDEPEEDDEETENEEEEEEMRITILTYIPTLKRIDKKNVTLQERARAREALQEREE